MWLRASLVLSLLCTLLSPGITAQTTQEMRFSVQVAALGSMDQALGASRQWARSDVPMYVVPAEVNGRTYYRVMAGMLSTRQEAVNLMNRLVAEGIKSSANAWDVKETGLAFRLGTHPSEAEAVRARDDAQSRGIPAYVVAAEENGGLAYGTWAGGFASASEATVLRGLLAGQGLDRELSSRTGLNPSDAQLLATRLAQEEAEAQQAAQRAAEEAAAAPPPVEETPPAQGTVRSGEPPARNDPPPPAVDPRPATEETPRPGDAVAEVPPTPAASDSPNFTSIFVGAVGTFTTYAGGLTTSGPTGYGGALIAGVLLGGYVELGGHGGAEYVSEEGAFGVGTATATVLSYSAFGGLYTPALALGGTSIRIGGRGGWSSGQVRVSVADISTTVDLETGVFVEPVIKVGAGSLGLIGAFRYFIEDTSPADWTASLGVIWGT